MFTTSLDAKTSTPLPPSLPLATLIQTLHDFKTIIKLNPATRACKPIPAPPAPPTNATFDTSDKTEKPETQHYEVEDAITFIPAWLWSGSVRYNSSFLPVDDGADLTVHVTAVGFTAMNYWRIVRTSASTSEEGEKGEMGDALGEGETGDGDYSVQISTHAKCPLAFAPFVRGFLGRSHAQLQGAFIDMMKSRGGKDGV